MKCYMCWIQNLVLKKFLDRSASFFGQEAHEHVKTIKNIVWRTNMTFFIKIHLKKVCFPGGFPSRGCGDPQKGVLFRLFWNVQTWENKCSTNSLYCGIRGATNSGDPQKGVLFRLFWNVQTFWGMFKPFWEYLNLFGYV